MSEPAAGPDDGFEAWYQAEVPPPWDIGAPQPAIVATADRVMGRVLDVGCGTGEHALFFASRGHDVWGIDRAPTAIARAQRKATARGLRARFQVADAFALGDLGEAFDTVIDSSLFDVFTDEERTQYVKSLASAVRPGGRIVLVCFSEHTLGDRGPRRVTRAELSAAFSAWTLEEIAPAEFQVTEPGWHPHAWRALIRR